MASVNSCVPLNKDDLNINTNKTKRNLYRAPEENLPHPNRRNLYNLLESFLINITKSMSDKCGFQMTLTLMTSNSIFILSAVQLIYCTSQGDSPMQSEKSLVGM